MAFKMEQLPTGSTPYVLIDEEKGYMKLEGRFFHEKVTDIFKEINDWLNDYLTTDFGEFVFNFELDYINSSASKLLFNMLLNLDKYASDKKKIIVNWISNENNEIMIEYGEDFREEMENLKFNIENKDEDPDTI